MAANISLNMNTLYALLNNTEILSNCEIHFNKAGNVTVQAPNSTTRYTIGALKKDPSKLWIRGCKYYNLWGRDIKDTPYRLNMRKVKDDSAWWGYRYEYTFDSVQEVYNYFCNFWRNYKLNK